MKDTFLREERDRDLFRCYMDALVRIGFKYQREAVDYVRTHPAPHYYVSPSVCASFMRRLDRGDRLKEINALARKKFRHIHDIYEKLREGECADMSCERLCEMIVERPAPQFYIGYEHASNIISEQINRYNDEQAEKYGR